MNRQLWMALAVLALPQIVLAQNAVQVVSFNAGTTASPAYNSLAAPLGAPSNTNGGAVFQGVVSPFNPPYQAGDLLSVGETGHVTLRLSNYVVPKAGAEIGVFTNVGLADSNYPSGQADAGPFTFGIDSAVVEVSQFGTSWVSLGDVMFDIPANAYTDLTDPYSLANGLAPSDSQLPFVGSLSDFANKSYAGASPNILDLLAGSAGGKWLDISASGLAQVGFIRFSVPENRAANVSLELDAVTIARGALGAPTVPEPTAAFLLVTAVIGCMPFVRSRAS